MGERPVNAVERVERFEHPFVGPDDAEEEQESRLTRDSEPLPRFVLPHDHARRLHSVGHDRDVSLVHRKLLGEGRLRLRVWAIKWSTPWYALRYAQRR